jgi:hypothetical protein
VEISNAEVAAVRAVLSGLVPRAYATQHYTAGEWACLAFTLLIAGDKLRFGWRGQYGKLLDELVIVPGVPVEGFPPGVRVPRWYYGRERIMVAAQSRGLLVRQGRTSANPVLVRHPRLVALLEEDEAYATVAASWLCVALEVVDRQHAADLKAVAARKRFMKAVGKHRSLEYRLRRPSEVTPEDAREIIRNLTRLLNREEDL